MTSSLKVEHSYLNDQTGLDRNSPVSNFWPDFLANQNFDHMYLIEIFKAIVTTATGAKAILQHYWGHHQFHLLAFEHVIEPTAYLSRVQRGLQAALRRQVPLILCWRYPPLVDGDVNTITHHTTIFADPRVQMVYSFDSRGVDYAKNMSEEWSAIYEDIVQFFQSQDFAWRETVYFDQQEIIDHDHFCQTWSLILLIDFFSPQPKFQRRHALDLHPLLSFWREILRIDAVREAIYEMIYVQTHPHGTLSRVYHQYFTTLETLVHRSNCLYYDFKRTYRDCQYTFLEDFVHGLTDELLKDIMSR